MDRFPRTSTLCRSEDHVGVRVGMFEMRGIEGISADKIFTIDGNIRANGMGNTIDNVSEAGTRASQCVLCSPLLLGTLPTVTLVTQSLVPKTAVRWQGRGKVRTLKYPTSLPEILVHAFSKCFTDMDHLKHIPIFK